MIILDANVLLYAYDSGAEGHVEVRRWLAHQFRSNEMIGLPWISLWAFLRVSTNLRVHRSPLSLKEAFEAIEEILRMPRAHLIQPGPNHCEILQRLANSAQANGPRMTDAVLAAIAVEQGATLASTDRDFARFADLDWVNPLG